MIYTKFWDDYYISSLNHKEKLTFIYLLTNDKVNLCGIYEIPDTLIQATLNLTTSEIKKIKEKFQKDSKFIFYNGWVRIVNVGKYNQFTGEKNKIAKERELSLAPKEILRYPMDRVSIGYPKKRDTPSNHNHNHIRVVKGKNISYLKKIPLEDIKEFEERFDLSEKEIKEQAERAIDWLKANGIKKKDYKAFLRNWLRKSLDFKKEKEGYDWRDEIPDN